MPDAKFAWKKAKQTSAAHAKKKAVLWPLTRRRSLSSKAVTNDVRQLQGFWRKRLTVLRDVGWYDLMKPGKVQFARNCPPDIAVAVADSPLRVCNMWHICPWCFSRKVGVVFDMLAKFVPARGKLQTPLRFLEFKRTFIMPVEDVGKMAGPTFQSIRDKPAKALKTMNVLGGYYQVQLDPKAVSTQYSAWRFTYRAVALVPPGWEFPEKVLIEDPAIKYRFVEVYGKKQIIGLVARVCRYPVGLMKGDPEMAMISLNARRGARASGVLGCFRANSNVETKAEDD